MKLTLKGDRLLVLPVSDESHGRLLWMPPAVDDSYPKRLAHSIVMQVGPGREPNFDMWGLKVGDHITHSMVGSVAFEGMLVIKRDAVTSVMELA